MERSDEVQKRIDQRMKDAVRQAEEAMVRAEEVRRRIEVGDVQPRPLPSLREDSTEVSRVEGQETKQPRLWRGLLESKSVFLDKVLKM